MGVIVHQYAAPDCKRRRTGKEVGGGAGGLVSPACPDLRLEPIVQGELHDSRIVVHGTDLSEGRVVDVEVGRRSVVTRRSRRNIERRVVREVDELRTQVPRMAI